MKNVKMIMKNEKNGITDSIHQILENSELIHIIL